MRNPAVSSSKIKCHHPDRPAGRAREVPGGSRGRPRHRRVEVDAVFNYDVPDSNEYYTHRIGRTAREAYGRGLCAVHEGTIQEVLVESVSDHDDHMVTGRLSNNILVHFQGDASMIGDYVNVKLDQCKGFYYIGEQV